MHRVGASFGEDPAVVCLSQWTNTVRLNRVSHVCSISYRLKRKRNKNKEFNRSNTHIFETTRNGQQARLFAEA
jgi:hypothetical protein